ncbi:sulfotransferase, partial [Tateyamaria sp.]|nr:sulfotransferase [Tateyamaria sp.]
ASARTQTIFKYLCENRLDRNKGAFFHLELRDSAKHYASNPVVTLFLILVAPKLKLKNWQNYQFETLSQKGFAYWKLPPLARHYHPRKSPSGTLASVTSSSAKKWQKAAIWQDENIVMLGYHILTLLGHAQSIAPMTTPLRDSNHHFLLILEHALFEIINSALAIELHKAMPKLIVRHDVDRILDDKTFERLTHEYQRRGVRASWYWIYNRTHKKHMGRLIELGHEICLHGLFNADKKKEANAIEKVSNSYVIGESYHGSGADYTLGAASSMATIEAGMFHSELNPFDYSLSSCAFPFVNDDAIIGFARGCTNITFSYSTDAAPSSRKRSVSETPIFALALLKAGYSVCILNHPDLNFDKLMNFLDQAEAIGVNYVTAQDVAEENQTKCLPANQNDISAIEHSEIRNWPDVCRLSFKNSSLPYSPDGVFIFGAPRTGSTLLANLLSTIPGAMPSIPEATVLLPVFEAYQKFKQIDDRHENIFLGNTQKRDTLFAEFTQKIVCAIADNHDGDLTILKSPIMSKHFDAISDFLPNFVFICTVRHPALIVRSMREWGQKAKERGARHEYISASDEEMYALIKEYYSKIFLNRDFRKGKRLRFVRYEDVITKDPKTVADILRLCGKSSNQLNFSNPFSSNKFDYKTAKGTILDSVTDLFGSAVDSDKFNQDFESLTEKEIDQANNHMGTFLSLFYSDYPQTGQ